MTYKQKMCVCCKTQFQPLSSTSLYCSPSCAYTQKRKQVLIWRKNNPEKHKIKCEQYNKNRKLKHLKDGKIVLEYEIYVCDICSKTFIPKSSIQKYCSKKCLNINENNIKKQKRLENIDIFRLADKKHYYKHHEKYKKMKVEQHMKQYNNNISFKLSELLRARLRHALKNNKKTTSVLELVGCSLEDLKSHLENKFELGMCWENHGLYGWHIDHILPCASFNLENVEEQCICFNYKNLQPLWATTNLSKGVST